MGAQDYGTVDSSKLGKVSGRDQNKDSPWPSGLVGGFGVNYPTLVKTFVTETGGIIPHRRQ